MENSYQKFEDFRGFEENERILLSKMYECHEMMLTLLNKGSEDPDYIIMKRLIKRLEDYIVLNNQNMI